MTLRVMGEISQFCLVGLEQNVLHLWSPEDEPLRLDTFVSEMFQQLLDGPP